MVQDALEAMVQTLPIWQVIGVVLALIAFNVVVAVVSAWRRGEFRWDRLADFAEHRLWRFVAGLVAVGWTAEHGDPSVILVATAIFYTAAAAIVRHLFARIMRDLSRIFGWPWSGEVPELPEPPAPPASQPALPSDPGA